MPSIALADQPAPKQPMQRAWLRASVSLPVLIESVREKHTAHIRDISAGGAMIETNAPLRRGSRIVLSCGTIRARGVIVWDGPGRYGLKFCSPVDDAEITQQLLRSDAAAHRRLSRTSAPTRP